MNDLMLHRAAQLLEAEFGPQWRTVADMLGTTGKGRMRISVIHYK